MVLQYYNYPSLNPEFQCGLVAVTFPNQCISNCLACQNQTIPSAADLAAVLTNYGTTVGIYTGTYYANLSAVGVYAPLSPSAIQAEINAGRPIVAGISPSGFTFSGQPQHATLVVGYDFSVGHDDLFVNDPFPYDFPPFNQMPDPYLAVGGTLLGIGRYRVPRAAFTVELLWTASIFGFHL
jgi:hypothetical protein